MRKYLIAFLFVSFLSSCNDNTVDPKNDSSFSLQLQVSDNNGNPVPNINISIWSKSSRNHGLSKKSALNKTQAATNIIYSLKQRCFVDLSSYYLDGKIKNNLVSGEYEAGYYQIQSDWNSSEINGAFKIKLIISSDPQKNNILYQDSIYTILLQPDPAVTVVGKTDSEGKLKITNRLLFPQLYNLPPIPITYSESPEQVGVYNFSDSTVIALSNESFTKSISCIKVVKEGSNNYQLNWSESGAGLIPGKKGTAILEKVIVKKLSAEQIPIPNEFKLYQNYPNPFN